MQKKIFYSAVVMIGIGIIMVYSLSAYVIISYGYVQTHFFQRQVIAALMAILLMWGISQVDIDRRLGLFGWLLLIGSFLCICVMPFLPESMATSAGGAKRWIRLGGFSLAPLEFFKIGFIYFIAWSFARKISHERLNFVGELKRFLPYMIIFVVLMATIVISQNDIGQVALLAVSMCIVLIFAGGSVRFVSYLGIAGLVLVVIVVVASPHRILRMKSWWVTAQDFILSIFPERFANYFRLEDFPEPYQIYHAGNAIWHGGVLGQGIGDGLIKLGFLSEVHTDMILAGIAEEIGILGIGAIIFLFVWGILIPILKIASKTKNQVHSLFCIGVACLLFFSFLINAFGVTGIFPVKGMAVPFLSYGGSSLLSTCVALGLVLAIAKKG